MSPRLRPGAPEDSSNPDDYEFGLDESDIQEYVCLADLLHASFTAVWSTERLTSYLIKLIDYVPAFLGKGDIHSLMRYLYFLFN